MAAQECHGATVPLLRDNAAATRLFAHQAF